jgi:FAD/FMN-containing dehydrogenase
LTQETFLEELQRAAGGPPAVLAGEAMVPYLTDWRGRFRGRALAVALPPGTAEVAAVLACCARHGVAIVPQGGNTGLVGGATPGDTGRAIVLGTRRMRAVREIDTANDTITVEAGCLLHEVQQAARGAGRLFPLSLAAEGSCTIGGNLSTNAGGTQVLRYGNARELALGLEVVLPDGRVWNGLRGLRKDNSGYDLKQLFIGAEGTLGVITAATLRLFALPRAEATALAAVRDLPAAIALLARARASAGAALTAFELVSGDCVGLLQRTEPGIRMPFAPAHPWLCLIEWADQGSQPELARRAEEFLAEALQAGLLLDAAFASSEADRAAMWRLRESIPQAQTRAGGNVKHDISLALGEMAGFLAEIIPALQALDARLQPYVFGHLGDGNLHCNVGVRAGEDPALAFSLEERINDVVYRATVRRRGSVSAEHGLGQLRRDLAARVKDPLEMALMRAVKDAIDPRGLMNPGKVLG